MGAKAKMLISSKNRINKGVEMIDATKMENNWETYQKLLVKACGTQAESLFETLGERIVMCPSNMKEDQGGAYPGGMLEHVLSVTMKMRKLSQALEWNLDQVSIIKVGLLHDLGKVGDLENSLYVEQDSDWHREKLGQMYKFNEGTQRMSVSHRTLYLLQSFGLTLSSEEWLAIQLASGSHFEENRFYVGSEPTLALLLQQSKAIVNHESK